VINTTTIIKARLITEIENRLNNRAVTASYLNTDNRIFEPYVDLLLINLQGRELHFLTLEIGSDIKRMVDEYEHRNRIKVNKSHLYFGLALNSIYLNSTINSSIYWELSQKEEAHTLGATFNPSQSIHNTVDRFSSAISGVQLGFNENSFYNAMKLRYSFIDDFKSTVVQLSDPHVFSYFSSGLRNRAIGYWVKNDFTDLTKMYGQELLSSVCILFESILKKHPSTTRNTLGNIMNHDLTNINNTVSNIVGHNHPQPPTLLCHTYPKNTFNTSCQSLINHIKTNNLNDDEFKAYVFYGMYLLRNHVVHDFDPNSFFNLNRNDMEDTIGLAICSIHVVMNL